VDEIDSDIPTIVTRCPNVDIWGINVYRGASFGNIFSQWQSASAKPFYFSEFGTDSYNTTSYSLPYSQPPCYEDVRAQVNGGSINQGLQAGLAIGLWQEIKPQLSAIYTAKLCAGGLIHEFNDELWKVGSWHVGLGGLGITTSYEIQDAHGLYLPGSHPDSVANEEYFGLVDADRNPKMAFNDLQNYYAALGIVFPVVGDKTVSIAQNLSFRVSATEIDNNQIALSAANLPSGASFPVIVGTGQVSQVFSWRPMRAGTYDVTFTATNSLNGSVSQVVRITVKKAVIAPRATD